MDMTVAEWLLDSDPSIRWQVMRDLTDAPDERVVAKRAKVAAQGWAAQLLTLQEPDSQWGGDPSNPEWTCLLSLLWLRDMGLDPASDEARRAVTLVRDNVTWHWCGNKPFFAGEVEPCINGRVVAVGSYFGQDGQGLVDRLLGEQMDDGGWNCEQENGSTRGGASPSAPRPASASLRSASCPRPPASWRHPCPRSAAWLGPFGGAACPPLARPDEPPRGPPSERRA